MNSVRTTTVTATDDREPSIAVVELVAEATDIDPLELDPLYNAIDPDVVDSLCSDSPGFSRLEFEYANHTVVIEQDGTAIEISLEPVTIGTDESVGVADGGRSL